MTTSRPTDWRWRSIVLVVLIAGGAMFFLGDLMEQLIGQGPFGWHLSRPAVVEGGLEVLALCALLALAATVQWPRWRAALLLVLGELYLRRHYVDLPMLADIAYFEILVGLGAGAARLCGLPPAADTRSYLRLVVAGIVLWSLGAWTLSAFGFGSLKILRLYTLALAVPAIAARHKPFSLFLWQRFSSLDVPQRAGVAALAAWFLCLAARTNVVVDFDGWWYGLRGDYVLVAGGSVFKSLDLVAPVHYYPKLYELLLIPVTALHDTSVIVGISILVLMLFALTCMELLKALALGFRARLLLTALCVTVPAIANAALSPKPDLFMAWLLLLACLDAARAARDGSTSAALWMLTAFALAFSSKLSAPPFILALLGATLAVWIRNGRPRHAATKAERRFAGSIAFAALVVAALVTARTWLLAGVPLVGPQQVVNLFALMGMRLTPPVGLLRAGPPVAWRGLPELMIDQLFRPQRLGHMVITWIGNVWLYLSTLALAARVLVGKPTAERPGVPVIWFAVILTGLILLITFNTTTPGGEGNYFVLPLALAILVGGYAALQRLPAGPPTRLLVAVLPLFVLFQATYSFVSAGWSPGTRAFDLNFNHGVRDLRKQNARVFQSAGMESIAAYLSAVPGIPRGVGYVADGPAFRLKGTFESLDSYEYWRREPLQSAAQFIDYLRDHRIDYLVLPKPAAVGLDRAVVPSVADAAEQLGALPEVRVIEDRSYRLYDLASLHAAARGER